MVFDINPNATTFYGMEDYFEEKIVYSTAFFPAWTIEIKPTNIIGNVFSLF
jgi:hypothetical protein